MTIGKIEKKQWASCSCGKRGFLGQSKKKKNSQQKNFPHKNVEFLIFQGLNHKIKTSKNFS